MAEARHGDRADRGFAPGLNCAQSVFTAFAHDFGVDITTDAGLQEARERNLFSLKCAGYVRDACAILESLL